MGALPGQRGSRLGAWVARASEYLFGEEVFAHIQCAVYRVSGRGAGLPSAPAQGGGFIIDSQYTGIPHGRRGLVRTVREPGIPTGAHTSRPGVGRATDYSRGKGGRQYNIGEWLPATVMVQTVMVQTLTFPFHHDKSKPSKQTIRIDNSYSAL
jgi:hypothetical protein